MDNVLTFLLDNLEMTVAAVGGIGVVFFITKKKPRNTSNDLTQLYIKYKRHSDSISKTTKTLF